VAVTQGDAPQQPPGPARPEQAPSPGPETQPGPNNLAPAQARASQASPGLGASGQAPSADLNFSQILEQQIAQAIQPVLDEFRQQMAQEVAQHTAATPVIGSGGQGAGRTAPQVPGAQASTSQPPSQQSPAQSSPPQQATPAAKTDPADIQAEIPVKSITQRPLAGALVPAVQAVEYHGAQWLQSLLVAGLGALLTESTHTAVQQRAELSLHTLLQKLFDAAPDGIANQEMQGKIERTLQLILRESLDAVFAEGLRTTLQQGGQQTIEQSLHGDFAGALGKVEDTLRIIMEALIAVLRRHQQTIVRLLLALALLALENSLLEPEKSKRAQAVGVAESDHPTVSTAS
jgi:hypothetical protein